jgi:hypothetical protein
MAEAVGAAVYPRPQGLESSRGGPAGGGSIHSLNSGINIFRLIRRFLKPKLRISPPNLFLKSASLAAS